MQPLPEKITDRFSQFRPEHFSDNPEKPKDLFKLSVSTVVIEIFSYCNRVCVFCPNSIIDRRGPNIRMDEGVWAKIVKNLAEVDYKGQIGIGFYNEPLADKIVLARIAELKKNLPEASININTNGDFLDRAYLDKLREAGLSTLRVQTYLPDGEKFSRENVKPKIEARAARLNLAIEWLAEDDETLYEAAADYEGLAVSLEGRNFSGRIGCSRGDLLAMRREPRPCPCVMPFYYVPIDYMGNVGPCCNIRGDAPGHRPFILGNLKEQDLFSLYAGPLAAAMRRNVFVPPPPTHTARLSAALRQLHFRAVCHESRRPGLY